MSLVDSPAVQHRNVKAARLVLRAWALLGDAQNLTTPETDAYDDLATAVARLSNYMSEQPQYVRDAVNHVEFSVRAGA